MANGESKGFTLQVQLWHLLMLFAVHLIIIGVAYGRITQNQEDTRKDVERIESQRVVQKDEFDDFKVQMNERMNRMEGKLDALVGLGGK